MSEIGAWQHADVAAIAGLRDYRIGVTEDRQEAEHWRLVVMDMDAMTGDLVGIGDTFEEALAMLARNKGGE